MWCKVKYLAPHGTIYQNGNCLMFVYNTEKCRKKIIMTDVFYITNLYHDLKAASGNQNVPVDNYLFGIYKK